MKPNITFEIHQDLLDLRAKFLSRGFDIRFVGGCVRDMLLLVESNDIDLCTDATPDEQLQLYTEFDIHNIPTGAQHGTYTVVMSGISYEITSLRTESDHDGRYATMSFTKDWIEDLSRRDLTINAMALTFDGELIDPFGGKNDLENHIVRFVGDGAERIKEDYLRIMRYFRFLGRFGTLETALDSDDLKNICDNVGGLLDISAERIWSEFKKIMLHPSGEWVIQLMLAKKIFKCTPLAGFTTNTIAHYRKQKLAFQEHNPITLFTSFVGPFDVFTPGNINRFAKELKWSTEERKVVEYIASHGNRCIVSNLLHDIAVNGRDRALAIEVIKYWGDDTHLDDVRNFAFEPFPVSGNDLLARGMKPGKEMGATLLMMKNHWFKLGCTCDKDTLLALIEL